MARDPSPIALAASASGGRHERVPALRPSSCVAYGDPDVLAELAAGVGMDAASVRAYLASDAGTREVRREIAEAQQLGVAAVSTYVFDDRYVVEGAQPSALFLRALQTISNESAATDVAR